MTIWELRFLDGRGASLYTTEDVTEHIGRTGVVRQIHVAASVFSESALSDAVACFREGRVLDLWAHMGAVAYALRHEPLA